MRHLILAATLLAPMAAPAQTPILKCEIDGVTTFGDWCQGAGTPLELPVAEPPPEDVSAAAERAAQRGNELDAWQQARRQVELERLRRAEQAQLEAATARAEAAAKAAEEAARAASEAPVGFIRREPNPYWRPPNWRPPPPRPPRHHGPPTPPARPLPGRSGPVPEQVPEKREWR